VIDIDTLFFVVVGRGKANAILRKARECGAAGGTIFLGEGTVQNSLAEKLGITEIHKEIIMIPGSDELCNKLHETLNKEFMFSKRNKGITFSIPFKSWPLKDERIDNEKASPYYCIMTIVDRGRSKDCIKAARAAGARGGTLIHGRGAGVPTDFYFPLIIEPQKDIVMIIAPGDKVAPIRERIFFDLELGKAGNGIIFALPVSRAGGLIEGISEPSPESKPEEGSKSGSQAGPESNREEGSKSSSEPSPETSSEQSKEVTS